MKHLHKILGADEPISLLVKNPKGLPDVALDVRVLEFSGGNGCLSWVEKIPTVLKWKQATSQKDQQWLPKSFPSCKDPIPIIVSSTNRKVPPESGYHFFHSPRHQPNKLIEADVPVSILLNRHYFHQMQTLLY